jgi:hypothetical protein
MNNIYNWVNLAGVVLVLVVMTLTEHDVINTNANAPSWLQWIRRINLGTLVILLCNAVVEDNSVLSLQLLEWSGLLAMAINAIAIAWRRPRDEKGKTYVAQPVKRRSF